MIKHFGVIGYTIRLISGKYLDLADPETDQFDLSDIAGGLSKVCRFGGQCPEFYSVAQHSVGAASIAIEDKLPIEVKRAVLLHDASEAFLGDVVKPLKIMLEDYAPIEERMMVVIGGKFGVDFYKHRVAIKEIDRAMLIAERDMLWPDRDGVVWTEEESVRKIALPFETCWSPREARNAFESMCLGLGIK